MAKQKKETKLFACNICLKDIIVGKEEYCILSQFKKDGQLYKSKEYHLSCWVDKFMNQKKLEQDSKLFMHKAFGLLDKLEAKA